MLVVSSLQYAVEFLGDETELVQAVSARAIFRLPVKSPYRRVFNPGQNVRLAVSRDIFFPFS